ncbi:Uncharacterized protein FWK35_00031602 [Aphis craccivora]|uniref:Uncharacterized protein n=1 Tax=Aphis craccivora TaxID=307492 RepID=A0A6G0W361_APHCR|nr:Uncharacterized protein FWK35_00031602 [Aphis craccivora]
MLLICPRIDNRSRMVELLKRNPKAEDVQEILCEPRLQDLALDLTSQSRLLETAITSRGLLGRLAAISGQKRNAKPTHHIIWIASRIVAVEGVTDHISLYITDNTTGGNTTKP